MDPEGIFNTILSDQPIERIVILLLAAAVYGLYRRANHLADCRVEDVQKTIGTTNTALSETTRALDVLATRLENVIHRG